LIEPPVCHHCGLPVYSHGRGHPVKRDASEYTRSGCTLNSPGLEGLRYAAFYGEVLRLAVGQFKYKDLRVLAGPLGRLMAGRWECLRPSDSEPDVIVPVALHPQREKARGYNQAALLADELSCQLGLPAVPDALVRVRDTMPQVGLSSHERRENVRGAFSCRGSTLSGRRVLLVDDVCTTGSTLEAAASALLDGGVESVWAYTLARPDGG
jgi:ComF family protein